MRIACGTVLFRNYSLEVALTTIREIGYEYVETQAVGPWCTHVSIEKTDPVQFAAQVRAHGFLGVTALWMPRGTLISDPGSVEAGLRTLAWANAAGIGIIHTGDGFQPEGVTKEEAFRLYEERIAILLEAAERLKVIIAIEPHGTFSLTGKGLARLMSVSQSPYLGVNYDACNVHRAAYVESRGDSFQAIQAAAGEDEVEVLRRIIDRVVHVHAKDIKGQQVVALGEGEVNLPGCLKLLKEAGYDGAVSVETEGDEELTAAAEIARKSRDYLLKMIGERE